MKDRSPIAFLAGGFVCLMFCGVIVSRAWKDVSQSHQAEIEKLQAERDAAWNAYRILADEKNVLESN